MLPPEKEGESFGSKCNRRKSCLVSIGFIDVLHRFLLLGARFFPLMAHNKNVTRAYLPIKHKFNQSRFWRWYWWWIGHYLEHLHPMIFPVAHKYVAVGHDSDSLEALKFGIA